MILDAFKFTNNLFLNNFSKFLTIVFPIYVIIICVYLQMASVSGNEFGNAKTFAYQELIIQLLTVYSLILSILLIDDIYKERKRSISNYFYLSAYLFIKILVLYLITSLAVILGLLAFILPGLYISARLYFTSYFAIIFNEGITDSLSKSYMLTQDKGWKLLGYLLAVSIPLLFIMIFLLVGPAIVLAEQNLSAYMAITYCLTFFFMVYITIYGYRLFNNFMEPSDESV